LHPNEGVVHRGIEASALTRRRHPIKERFEANPWDGVSRTNDLAMTICGPGEDAAEDIYNARCIRQWAISAVKRVYEPGCKADSMLVLFAEAGGEGKTTALAALVGENTGWYNTSPVSMDEKRTLRVMPYFWVHEVAEMPMRSNNEEYMNFIDRTHDSGIGMHGVGGMQNVPRQCVLWGSTNRRLFLVDRSSENRRYLVLEVRHSNIDIQRIRDLSLQFWAEIYAAYRAGERSYPSPEERAETGYRNRQYLADDSVEETVAAIFGLSTKTFWTSLELRKKVNNEAPELRATDTAIGLAASKFGWTNTRNSTHRGWKWNGSKKPHAVPPKTAAPITDVPPVEKSAFPHAPVNAK
jgi:putative DNA primase/helicase